MASLGHRKRIVVLGASGFLGARIAQDLHQSGSFVTGLSRSTPVPNVLWEQLRTDEYDARQLKLKADVVINCAGPDSDWMQQDPDRAAKFARQHGERVLQIYQETGANCLIHFSTIHVHSSQSQSSLPSSEALDGASLYPRVHTALEKMFFAHASTCSLRLSNSFGSTPSMRSSQWKAFTQEIVKHFVTTGVAEIRANPGIKRDFVPLSMASYAVCKVIHSGVRGTKNVTSSRTVTLGEWAEQIRKIGLPLLEHKLAIRKPALLSSTPDFRHNSDFEFGEDIGSAAEKELVSLFKIAIVRNSEGQL